MATIRPLGDSAIILEQTAMRTMGLTAALCGFGAGLVTFPILVAHLECPGLVVTLMGLTFCLLGALATGWTLHRSSQMARSPKS
jgi:uncharacterized membrane protein YfcA